MNTEMLKGLSIKRWIAIILLVSFAGIALYYCDSSDRKSLIVGSVITSLIIGWVYHKISDHTLGKTVLMCGIAVAGLMAVYKYGSTLPPEGSSYSGSSSSSSSDMTYTCKHCEGKGNRYNNVTGAYGKCASCGGAGRVNQWTHDHQR